MLPRTNTRRLLLTVLFASLAAAQSSSSVILAPSLNPSNYGHAVTLTATVTPGATGKVTFYDGTTVLGTSSLNAGQATFATVLLPSGSRYLRAHYAGDSSYAPSNSATVTQTVAAQPSMGLNAALNYPARDNFGSFAVADLNGDGKPDLVAAGIDEQGVILLGNGDGTFQTLNGGFGRWATSVAVGDFNGDGKPDLIFADSDTNTLNVALGNGDGTFGTPASYPLVGTPISVAAGDFNGDGKPDVVVAVPGSVVVFLGSGDGTLQAAVGYAASNAGTLALGDFNGDGITDLLVGGQSEFDIQTVLGNGDGTFQAAVSHTTRGYSGSLVVADFNGDGKDDVALSDAEFFIDVLLGNGDATFQAPWTYPTDGSVSLAAGDIDGDGKTDLIASAFYTPGSVMVFTGNGDGSFQSPVKYPLTVSSFAVGDFNGDGRTDLVLSTYGDGPMLSVMLGGAAQDLSISLAHGPGFTQGQTGATYTIGVTNIGQFKTAGKVIVTDTLPTGFAATAISGTGWTCVLATLSCTRSDALRAGSAYPAITITANISATLTGDATDSATVSGGGDSNLSNNTAAVTVSIRPTVSVSLTSSPNPSALGQLVTLTARIVPATTGEVTFYDGITVLGSGAIAGGQAILTTGLLPSGATNLVAVYSADSTYGLGISPVHVQLVNAAPDNGLRSAGYKVDTSPEFLAVGDFNLDGNLDLVTVNIPDYGAGSVSVLLGNGDGTFRAAVNYPAGDEPNTVAVADFNRDGKPDLAVAGVNGMYVLLGNGDGSFKAPVTISQTGFSGLVVADVNQDGFADLLSLSNSGGISTLLGNGDGTFQVATNTPISGVPYWVVADVNGDGKPDLVVVDSNNSGPVKALLGNGDGTFLPPLNSPGLGQIPFALTTGDFNGDGKQDVALLYWVGVASLLGNGDGTFQAPLKSSLSQTPGYIATTGDFNADGKLDIAYRGYAENTVTVVLGNGDGTFQSGSTYPTDGISGNVVLADFNGDGTLDLAVPNVDANTVNVFLGGQFSGLDVTSTHTGYFLTGQSGAVYLLNISNPALTSFSGTASVTDTLPAGLTATAIGGTGWTCVLGTATCTRSDALTTGGTYPPITVTVTVSGSLSPSTVTNRASVSTTAGTNTATDPTLILAPSLMSLQVTPGSSVLGEPVTMTAMMAAGASGTVLFLDGMSVLGVSAISAHQAQFTTSLLPAGVRQLRAYYGGNATLQSGSATSSFTVSASPAGVFGTVANSPTGGSPAGIAAGDFNNDGKTDLVTANSGANTVSVLLGNGDGTFRAHADTGVGVKPVSVAVGDFNGDGNQDLAVVNQTANAVSILLGNGDGTFHAAAAVPGPGGTGPSTIAVGDFSGDGIEDVVLGSTVGSPLSVFFGKGDGTFQTPVVSNLFNVGTVLLVVDLNGDGKADLLVGNHYFSALLGNGDGSFQLSPWVGFGNGGLAAGDLNGDGKMDVVYGGTPAILTVQLGSGDGNFTGSQTYPLSFNPSSLVMADVNGDGNLDVIGFLSANNSLVIMLGNGDGTLQGAIYYNAGFSPAGLIVGEFNGDGRTDLALTDGSNGGVEVALGMLSPLLSVTSVHDVDFYPGQTGAAYIITVTNHGQAPTSGTVTVVDTMPAGLTPTAIGGSGWSCVAATLTCTRADPLDPGISYPVITITVNVAVNNPLSTVINDVAATNGLLQATGSDSTNITSNAPPPAPFFIGQIPLGSGVYYLQFLNGSFFGYYNFQFYPILYHYDMGFEAFVDGGNGAAYLYDFSSGHWFYTSSLLFPYLYDFTLNNWLYYIPANNNPGHYSTNPRYFSDLTTGKIITM